MRHFLQSLTVGAIAFACLDARAIEDGRTATEHEFPYVYGLKFKIETHATTGSATCSGTLVHPRLILSAAHCFVEGSPLLEVSNSVEMDRDGHSGKVSVARFGYHPDYQNVKAGAANEVPRHILKYAEVDIAFIRLAKDAPVAMYPKIQVIRTFTDSLIGIAHSLTLVGYGSNIFTASDPRNVSGAGTKRVGHHPFGEGGATYYRLHNQDENFLSGDSGGPLLLEQFDRRPLLLGHAHKILPGTHVESYVNHRGHRKTRNVVSYVESIATAYTPANLCWVERESGIDLEDVDCPAGPAPAKKKHRKK
jgi:hypothetical protein